MKEKTFPHGIHQLIKVKTFKSIDNKHYSVIKHGNIVI